MNSYSANSATLTNDAWSRTTLSPWDTANTTGNYNVVVPTAWANVTSGNFASASSHFAFDTVSSVNGPVSYSGSGNVYGGLELYSPGNITVTNAGTIGAPQGGGYLTIQSVGQFQSQDVSSYFLSNTSAWMDSNVSTNGTAWTLSHNDSSSATSNTMSAHSETTNGGNATLINSGTIGGNASTPIQVQVIGPAGAYANNSGTIKGDITVSSDGSNYMSFSTLTGTDTSSVSTVSLYKSGKGGGLQSSTGTTLIAGTTSSSSSSVTMPTGGNATLVDSGTVAGGAFVFADKNALVTNSGAIWGEVELVASAEFVSTQSMVTGVATSTISFTVNPISGSSTTTSIQIATGSIVSSGTQMSTGGNATLINSGSIGLLVGTSSGNLSVWAEPNTGYPPDVILWADQYANVTNSGSILGNVSEHITGWSASSKDTSNFANSATTTTITAPSIAGNGSMVTIVNQFVSSGTENFTFSSADTGGTAVLTNNGNIGQSFSSSLRSGGGVVGGGGVYLYGEAGATLTNNGLIGTDAIVSADAYSYSTTSTSVGTSTGTFTTVEVSNSLTVTSTTVGTVVNSFSSSSTKIERRSADLRSSSTARAPPSASTSSTGPNSRYRRVPVSLPRAMRGPSSTMQGPSRVCRWTPSPLRSLIRPSSPIPAR